MSGKLYTAWQYSPRTRLWPVLVANVLGVYAGFTYVEIDYRLRQVRAIVPDMSMCADTWPLGSILGAEPGSHAAVVQGVVDAGFKGKDCAGRF